VFLSSFPLFLILFFDIETSRHRDIERTRDERWKKVKRREGGKRRREKEREEK